MKDHDSLQERTCRDEQFWAELVDAEALDQELLNEYLSVLKIRPWKPLGSILISEGYLTIKQVAALLGFQADEPNLRIGELAVREGYCEAKDIARALQLQRETSPGPIDMMIADARIDESNLMSGLIGYIHFLESRIDLLSRDAVAA